MKKLTIISLALTGITLACNQPAKTTMGNETPDSLQANALPKDSTDYLLVPGDKAGPYRLNQDMKEIQDALGKADDGDAAMGKSWGIWNKADTLAIYATYKDTAMNEKVARQIVVRSNRYALSNGITPRSALADIQAQYPKLKQAAMYINERKDTLFVYDDEEAGIAFDVKRMNGELIADAITIHPAKESVNSTYLNIHGGWRKLP